MSKRKAKEDEEAKGFKKTTPMHLKSLHERDQAKRLIVILEGASLETIKVCMTVCISHFCLTLSNPDCPAQEYLSTLFTDSVICKPHGQ